MDNLQTIWATVDLHRAIANDLETHARLLGGDRPEVEFVETNQLVGIGGGHTIYGGMDKIQAYKDIVEALEGAKDTLEDVAKQEGKLREPLKFASKCHVHSKRCERALEGLLKVGEL